MMDERLYVITYDISDQTRWRAMFKLMKGHGGWRQLSVFQCRLSRKRHAELLVTLDELIKHEFDHILMLDLGTADKMVPRVVGLGKVFAPVTREVVVV